MTAKQRHRYYLHWRLKNKFQLPVNAKRRELQLLEVDIKKHPAIVQKYLQELINIYKYNIQLKLL